MANLIQIKRSDTTAVPGSLEDGELAYTSNGEVLFIGSNGSVVAIGGQRSPGVLTANQALVVNSSSSIDSVKVANLVPTKIYANGSHGTLGQVLVSDGANVFWGTGTAGSNTTIQFNDSGTANGITAFTFNKAKNTMFVANAITVGANVTVSTVSINVGNTTTNTVANSSGVFTTGTVNGDVVQVGTAFKANTTQVTVNTTILTTTGNLNVTGVVNTTAGINTNGPLSVTNTAGLGNTTITGFANVSTTLNVVGAATVNGALTVNNTAAVGNTTITGFANVSSTLNVTGATTVNGALTVNNTAGLGNTTITGFANVTGHLQANSISVGDTTISGNLTVTGTLTTVSANNITITDSMIQLASNNTTTDVLDIGLFGSYEAGDAGNHEHTGFFRDASDSGVWKLFENLEPSPTTTVDTGNATFSFATLQSFIKTGGAGLTGFIANATNIAITANSTLAVGIVANTLSLSTALPGTSWYWFEFIYSRRYSCCKQ